MDAIMRRYLTEREQGKLLATIKQFGSVQARRDRAWICLMLVTGCRVGEFSRLTLKHARIALDSGWLLIPAHLRKGWQRKPRLDKAGRTVKVKPPPDLYLPVTAPVMKALNELVAIAREMAGDVDDDTPLVMSRRHLGMSVRGFQDRFAVWCAQAGIDASPHWLRHTRAMNIKRKSTSSDVRALVMASLGHADISSSAIYMRVSKEDLARELAVVDGGRRASKAAVRGMFEGSV